VAAQVIKESGNTTTSLAAHRWRQSSTARAQNPVEGQKLAQVNGVAAAHGRRQERRSRPQ